MKNQEVESSISRLLNEAAILHRDWVQSPQVAHIPFMGTRENFFLLINLYICPAENNEERLVNDAIAVAKLIIGSNLLTDEKGLEVAAFICMPEPKKFKRVFRLSIRDTEFLQVMKTEFANLSDMKRAGITVQWPLH